MIVINRRRSAPMTTCKCEHRIHTTSTPDVLTSRAMPGVFEERRGTVSGTRTHAISANGPSAVTREDGSAARGAAATTLGGMSFLATYMVVHASFIVRCTPASILRLSTVPLFATALASAGVAALTALLGLLLLEDATRLLPRLKVPLAVVTLLFALEMLFAP